MVAKLFVEGLRDIISAFLHQVPLVRCDDDALAGLLRGAGDCAILIRRPDRRIKNEHYDIGALESLEPIAEGVQNTNYRLRAGGKSYVLTLFESRTRTEDLPEILGLTAHLAAQGFPTPQPMPRRDGVLLGQARGRPAVLIPLPSATDDHQRRNAAALADAGAAVVLEEKNLTGERLAATIVSLVDDRAALERMGQAMRRFARPDAAERIADRLEALVAAHG